MTTPVSLLNDRSQSIDTLWKADGVTKIKLAIGEKTVGALTPKASWQGVASHTDADTFGASDGVVVVAGTVISTDAVKRLLVDSSGRLLFGQKADDAAYVGGDYAMPAGFLADETATDSVDEGDIAIARVTLDRRQITAAQQLDDAAFGIATAYVDVAGFLVDETATDSADEGDVGAARMTADRKQIATLYAHAAAGGTLTAEFVAAGSNNATSVKGSAGRLYKAIVNNLNGAARYLKFYNKATAPAPASDTVKLSLPIPPGTVQIFDFGDLGIDFTTGIALALVTGISNTDNTAVTASEHVVTVVYA